MNTFDHRLVQGLSLCALLATLAGVQASDILIASSHTAQVIHPDEMLTLTITASGEAPRGPMRARLLDSENRTVRENTLPTEETGVWVDRITDLDVGIYPYHVFVGEPASAEREPDAWTRIAVVPRPDPTIGADDSPVGVDAWLAWRFPGDLESVERASALMRRIGIHWVRDRLSWDHTHLASELGAWDWSRYEPVYRIESEAGLNVIAVFHDVAHWASPTGETEPAHRPTDLFHLINFGRGVGLHLGDVLEGVEIGNEINSPLFWRGSSADCALYVKAMAIGLAQGDPDLLRLLGSTTDPLDRPAGLADAPGLLANNTLPFVHAVTPHHYGPPHGLAQHVRWYREHAPDHPIWITEVGSTAVPKVGPLIGDEEAEQAAYLAEAFEFALEAGAERVFYFCLMDFYEHGERPFGLVEAHGDHWVPRAGLIELARLAATRRLPDDRIKVTRSAPPPIVADLRVVPPWVDPEDPDAVWVEARQADRTAPVDTRVRVFAELVQPGASPEVARTHDSMEVDWRFPDQPATAMSLGHWPGPRWASVSRLWDSHPTHLSIHGQAWPMAAPSLADTTVVDVELPVPLVLSRPSLLDVTEPIPSLQFSLRNETDEEREATVTWGDGEAPRYPLMHSQMKITLDPRQSATWTFSAAPGSFLSDSRDEHMHVNSVKWISGADRASGEATPEWNGIAARKDREIQIDANLEDWMGLWGWRLDDTHTVVGPAAMGEATLRALWDEEALWLAAVVHDDDLLNPAPVEQPWTGDSLEIYLDVNGPEEIGQAGYNGRVFQIQVTPALPDLPSGHAMFSRPEDHPADGIERAVRTSESDGRIIMIHEIRLPWSTLGLSGPPPSRLIGFDWAVNDLDTEGMSRSQMVWRGTVDNWRDPSGFPRIWLAEEDGTVRAE